ncbi:MAG: DUF5115 domain-containing protein [Prevotella sp.]|nr:DUF5115 domain-containing protein [Prevotella sp.]
MMKKIFFGLALVASVFACTDDYTDWADPQTNAAPAQVSFSDGSVSAVNVINFAEIPEDQSTVKVCNITAPSSSDAGYTTPLYTITLGDQTFDITADGTISAEDLKAYVVNAYGKAPTQRDIQATVSMWLSNGTTAVKTATSDPFNVSVILKAPFIDEGYYIVGDMVGWSVEGAKPFTHVGSGNVYDNSEFTIVFTTTADNQYWKIIPKGNYEGDLWYEGETGVVGTAVDGDTSMGGSLVTESPKAGKIEKAGIYKMTINMMEYTYSIEKLDFAPFIYFIGSTDGWTKSVQKLETTTFDGVYTGYLYCADPNGWGNAFKFQRNPGSWDNEINSGTFSGGISGDFADGGGNINVTAGEGVYYVVADLAAGTLTGTRINNMNLVGDFNGWNAGDDAQQMTWDAENYCYVITNAGVNSNGWKFTANNDWGINLGGNDSVEPSMVVNDLVANGKNLGAVGKTIKLYPTRITSDKIYCTVE